MSLNHNAQALFFQRPASARPAWQSSAVSSLPTPTGRREHSAATHMPEGTLTEVFCQADSRDQLRLLVPVLAELSQQHKWITLIAPPCIPNERLLARAGVDTRKILVIHTKSIKDYWNTLEQMLANGMSSTVLAWLGREFDETHRDRLKAAANKGGTVAFVLRQIGGAKSTPSKPLEYETVQVEQDRNPQMSLAF